jgi:hypothetical protein
MASGIFKGFFLVAVKSNFSLCATIFRIYDKSRKIQNQIDQLISVLDAKKRIKG